MNALDTPLEAQVFNYLSFSFSTALNNLWTWLAVVTVAASFWKIRAAAGGCAGHSTKSQHPDDRRINEPMTTVSTSTTAVNFVLETDCGANEGKRRLRRGKFTVYYFDESVDGVKGDDWTASDGGEGCYNWERGLRMSVGEDVGLGWYSYQDLTVIDGNVVRLWDWEFN